MPNQVEFIVYDPALPLPVDFNPKPQKFYAQFVQPAPGVSGFEPLPDPASLAGAAQLTAAALDAGDGDNRPPMPVHTAADLIALQNHLVVQKDLVQSLVGTNTVGSSVVQPFAVRTEKSGKTSNSFALGMLYARVATGLWAQANSWGAVKRFWHFGVLASTAVSFHATAVNKALNPDFVVQHGNGVWACVEAKGTLGAMDRAELKKGMHQACKMSTIQWQAPKGGPLQRVVVAAQACVMTYFAAPDGTLEVVHMDPPGSDAGLNATDPEGPVWLLEGADFVRWFQALAQFDAMPALSPEQGPADRADGELDWARWPGRPDMWVGVPSIMRAHTATVDWALDVLRWMVPALGRWRDRSIRSPELDAQRVAGRLHRMAAHARKQSRLEASAERFPRSHAWQALATLLRGLARSGEPMAWQQTLAAVWDAPLLDALDPPDRGNYGAVGSLNELWHLFDAVQTAIPSSWRLDVLLPLSTDARAVDVFSEPTSHGLLVVAAKRR